MFHHFVEVESWQLTSVFLGFNVFLLIHVASAGSLDKVVLRNKCQHPNIHADD